MVEFGKRLKSARMKSGLTQEQLSSLLNVSRTHLSKMEQGERGCSLDSLVEIAEELNVSTDYLLRDELGSELPEPVQDFTPLRRVTMEEATAFLHAKEKTSRSISIAVFLCMISPICLIALSAMSEFSAFGVSENFAVGVGIMVLLVIAAAAVTLFIHSGGKTSPFQYLENEVFETEYGVSGMVKERKAGYRDTYTRYNIIGA